ncbi:ATP synthase subunit I [Rhodoblastus sp.]|uniref:N-ATPase subunit AtpR n=1 Tax=Rhodoblastus sp. TaxID=1962975 RepID=UPI0025FAA64C|nr:ATP synthase subunit I [Rhodoblastus sp.]
MIDALVATAHGGASYANGLNALFGLAVGALLGLAHFGSLWWNTRLYADGGFLRALAVQLGRFGLLIVVLAALAKIGAPALLGGALGVFFTRGLLLRRLGRTK